MALHDLRRLLFFFVDRHQLGEIYRRQGGRLAPAEEISAEGALSTPLPPRLEIRLSEVFE